MTAVILRTSNHKVSMSTFTQTLYRNLCGFVPRARAEADTQESGLDRVHKETDVLTKDLIYVYTGSPGLQPIHKLKSPPNKVCETMRNLIRGVLASEGQRFENLTDDIELEKLSNTPELVVDTVLQSMFEDGRVHWLRVVAAYVFSIKLAEKCAQRNRVDLQESVIKAVGEYIKENVADWIFQQGGWVNVTTVFVDQVDVEQKLRSVGYLALAVGVGALLSAVTSR